MEAFHEKLSQYLRAGRSVAVATIVAAKGSTPRKVGSKMIVREGGEIDFTLGGGPFEALVIEDAKIAIGKDEPTLNAYRFLPVGENATGMVCGGEVEVFIDVYRQPARVVVFGGGHVGHALAQLAKSTGFRVAVLDDRPEFANAERFPEADELVHAEGGYIRSDFPLEPDDYVVIVTRCHETDEACLRLVLEDDVEPAYVGVVASKRKAKVLLAKMMQEGFAKERLEEIRTPIGLDIGAETPSEIAVSVVGEILAERTRASKRAMSEETSVPGNVTVRRVPHRRPRERTRAGSARPKTTS